MSRFYKFFAMVAMSAALAIPAATAQRPGNSGNGSGRPGNNGYGTSQQQRPHQSTQRPQNGGRPDNSATKPSGNNKPGNPGQGHKPNNPGQGYGPGHNNNPGQGHKPNNPGPGHNNPGPGYGPGPGPNHNPGTMPPPQRPPYRPHMPSVQPYRPPVPPAGYRPMQGAPSFTTILGIALGATINSTINYLLSGGYAVTGYTGGEVYLNDVYQLNMLWPNATLYYNRGMLAGSEFVYSTPYYDMNRYNLAYRTLVNAFGMPVSSQAIVGGGVQVSWFGYDGRYVSLRYLPANAYDRSYRYYTILSFGI